MPPTKEPTKEECRIALRKAVANIDTITRSSKSPSRRIPEAVKSTDDVVPPVQNSGAFIIVAIAMFVVFWITSTTIPDINRERTLHCKEQLGALRPCFNGMVRTESTKIWTDLLSKDNMGTRCMMATGTWRNNCEAFLRDQPNTTFVFDIQKSAENLEDIDRSTSDDYLVSGCVTKKYTIPPVLPNPFGAIYPSCESTFNSTERDSVISYSQSVAKYNKGETSTFGWPHRIIMALAPSSVTSTVWSIYRMFYHIRSDGMPTDLDDVLKSLMTTGLCMAPYFGDMYIQSNKRICLFANGANTLYTTFSLVWKIHNDGWNTIKFPGMRIMTAIGSAAGFYATYLSVSALLSATGVTTGAQVLRTSLLVFNEHFGQLKKAITIERVKMIFSSIAGIITAIVVLFF